MEVKDLADRLLSGLGESIGVGSLTTNSSGLARLSVTHVGMVDFELSTTYRCLTIYVEVGKCPDDLHTLLRGSLEYAEMAGFTFCSDGFKSQTLLTTSFYLDGLDIKSLESNYLRLLDCARYWRKKLSDPNLSSTLDSQSETSVSTKNDSSFLQA